MTIIKDHQLTRIDGSQGEGGGQVLRTSLALAMLLNKPIELINIRANRKKPGLQRQHLTCVKAAQAISNAECTGAELGADRIVFKPRQVTTGEYRFSIGTAGSTVLVCQTIMLPLALAGTGKAIITLEGGTHNGLSPSLTFFEQSFIPALKTMGFSCQIVTEALGFNPAGGGKWQITIEPIKTLSPFQFEQAGQKWATVHENCAITAIVGQLPKSIAEREIKAARKKLNWAQAKSQAQWVNSIGTGNSFHLQVKNQGFTSMFEQIGQFGVSAERVANRTAGILQRYLKSNAAVEEHLADQLLLPMVLAGQGSYTTNVLSSHTTTNIAVIQQLTGQKINTEQIADSLWRISL